MEIRWRFKINADVEETECLAVSKGFSARQLEGQSRTNDEPYPLNQVEITNWNFSSDVKVVVSPTVTQVYFNVESIPKIAELENIVMDLGKVEKILNEVVVFAEDETARFSMETEIPVMSIGMLKVQHMLKEETHRAFERLYELVLREVSIAPVFLIQGKIGYAMNRLDILSNELINFQRDLIKLAKDQGIAEADKWESELNEMTAKSKSFEAELASARSPIEFRHILDKYLIKAFCLGD